MRESVDNSRWSRFSGCGLFVTVVVGFGLATMIVTHNKAIESAAAGAKLEPPAKPDRPR